MKTLKDISICACNSDCYADETMVELQEAARAWCEALRHGVEHEGKKFEDYDYEIMITSRWIKHFFNLGEKKE